MATTTTWKVGRASGATVTWTAQDSVSPVDSTTWSGTQLTGAGVTRVQDLSGGHLSNATTGIISFPGGVYADATDFDDFGAGSGNNYGYALPSGVTGLVGTGIDNTIIEVSPNTMSTGSAAKIPLQSAGGTNPLTLIRMDGGSPSALTIKGTDQTVNGTKQLYNGLQFWFMTGKSVGNFKVQGIPGDNAANPGETFPLKSDHGSSMTYHDIEIDGTDGSGNKVSATGFGLNSASGTTTINDCNFHDMGFGHGISAYQATGTLIMNRVICSGSPGCFNFERCNANITLNNCTFQTTKTGTNHSHIIIDSNVGSSKLSIVEPSFDTNTTFPNQLVVCVHASYLTGQLQLPSDISMTLGGVTYTATGIGSFGPLRIVQHGAFG